MDVKHAKLKQWVDEMAQMCQPDKVVWIDGGEEQKQSLFAESTASGEFIELDPDTLPGCHYHRSALNDVARTESLTFICTTNKKDVGPTNNWMAPEEGYAKAREIFEGSMRGRTMYAIPFSMGPIGAPLSKIGVELTDSIYVVQSMLIMTRAGAEVLDALGADGEYTQCLHGKAELDIEKRLILHFPEDNVVWSVGSGYGGNALLGKKCLALRIASCLARNEGWMAEHMLILGIERPGAEMRYIAAAFPSACGKTNLAMLVPPKELADKGYRVETVGDDIAWMQVGEGLRAINPEFGFFGVAPGTNYDTNPNAMKALERNSIYTNVLLTSDNGVWWEDGVGDAPASGTNWQGLPWSPGAVGEDGKPLHAAHPNSRYTAPLKQCPSISDKLDDPAGVKIDAILFGGRRASLAPLVYQSFDWEHGVFLGSIMGSERTAAAEGAVGQVRRDPMAMLPFCGYNMSEYFRHWLEVGQTMSAPPKIFHTNWFRRDKEGNFLWPGYGDNLRVLDWILDRCDGKTDARETAIGHLPNAGDINLEGLDMAPGAMDELLSVPAEAWRLEADSIAEHYKTFGDELPQQLHGQHAALKKRLEAND